jgi:hypothetical protein
MKIGSTSPQDHPIGIAPVNVPDGHCFWQQISGHYDEDSSEMFQALMQNFSQLYFVIDTEDEKIKDAATVNEPILIVLPYDAQSYALIGNELPSETRSAIALDIDSVHSVDLFPKTDSVPIPNVKHSDGYILIHSDGLKRHIWFNFRQADSRVWPEEGELTKLTNVWSEGLFGHHVFKVVQNESAVLTMLENNGWYLPPFLRADIYLILAQLYKRGWYADADYLAISRLSDQLDSVLKEWLHTNLFCRRELLLQEVVDVYRQGKYAASLTLALAQFSGVVYDRFENAKDNKIGSQIETLIGANGLQGLVKPHLLRFVKNVFCSPGRNKGASLPHDRKSIMHGNKINFTQRDALQGIILLDCLYRAIVWGDQGIKLMRRNGGLDQRGNNA